ncbi:MAG: hypothetical protein WBB44_10950 [Candidatus Nanopelagicales bacterium]
MGSTRNHRRAGLATTIIAIGLVAGPLGSAQAVGQPAVDPPPTTGSSTTSNQPEPEIGTPGEFAVALLNRGNWPVTGDNVCAAIAWERAEGGHFVAGSSRFNPLNTTQSMPGDSIFNSVGVRNYPNWNTGLAATVGTLALPYYDDIRLALASGNDPVGIIDAVGKSVWGTKFADPVAAIDGSCLAWAQGFDRDRNDAKIRVEESTQAVASAQDRVSRAQADQIRTDTAFARRAAEVKGAQAQLGELARSMYIAGIEPEIASNVEAIESGDPIGYAMVTSYSGYAGNRKNKAVNRAVDLLDQMAAARKRAADELQAAKVEVDEQKQKLVKAQQRLATIEAQASSQA